VALLVGIVRGPSWYDPRRNPERALERRNFALGEFRETNLINEKEYQRALKAPLGITEVPGSLAPNRFPAYVDLVRRQLARDYPADQLVGAGLSVMTGMSPSAQALAEGAVARTLKSLDNKRRPPLQAGLVVTDVHNGEVIAVVGSRVYSEHGFNRAVEAQRPVGSLLKPFVYLLALATPDRYSLASYVDDSPVTVDLGRGKKWSPGNSDGRSHGSVRLIDALAMSYNQATVRVGMKVAPERIADLIRTLAGIQAEPRPSLILGALDQSPYAMAQLYQFLASGGQIQPLHAVRGVLDANGRALNRYDTKPAPAQEGDAIAARLITIAASRPSPAAPRHSCARWPGAPQCRRQDRHQQRRSRQLVRRLDRGPPRRDLGRQRPEQGNRPVRRHRRDAGVVGDLLAPAQRAAAGRATRVSTGSGWRQQHHRRRLRGRAPLRLRRRFRAAVRAVPDAGRKRRKSRAAGAIGSGSAARDDDKQERRGHAAAGPAMSRLHSTARGSWLCAGTGARRLRDSGAAPTAARIRCRCAGADDPRGRGGQSTELDVQPLRDPQVEDLRQQAAQLEARQCIAARPTCSIARCSSMPGIPPCCRNALNSRCCWARPHRRSTTRTGDRPGVHHRSPVPSPLGNPRAGSAVARERSCDP
jgi:hypothetical protein